MIDIRCCHCDQELHTLGGQLIAPEFKGGNTRVHHICQDCWTALDHFFISHYTTRLENPQATPKEESTVEEQARKQVAVWNEHYPPGTTCRRYANTSPLSGAPLAGYKGEVVTYGPAWALGGHTAVVQVSGVASAVALDCLVPIRLPRRKDATMDVAGYCTVCGLEVRQHEGLDTDEECMAAHVCPPGFRSCVRPLSAVNPA